MFSVFPDCSRMDILDEEEMYERRKLDRKLREKEAQYQELLTKWEARERKKSREYGKELEREDEKKGEEVQRLASPIVI